MSNEFKDWLAEKKEEVPKNIALMEKYPWLRIEGSADLFTWLDDMPDGWRKAFGAQFCEDLQSAYENLSEKQKDEFSILEIKEKYGGLRIYCTGETLEIADVLHKYEEMSYNTCIKCGAPAVYKTSGYVLPFCADCAAGEVNGNT